MFGWARSKATVKLTGACGRGNRKLVDQNVSDCDPQLRLCVGDSVDKLQTPRGSDSSRNNNDREAKDLSPDRPPETLYLSRSKLQEVSENLLKNGALKYLYLEGNELQSIPPSMFTSLSNLLWLDLRHNQIQSLPTEIGRHRRLRTLLLEGNPITELPPELGNVLSLNGLNIRDCPLRYPPSASCSGASSASSNAPVVERLQLDLVESGVEEEEDGAAEEEELERFRELKLQMSLMEKAERETSVKPPKPHTLPALKRKKATRAAVTPAQFSAPAWNRSEERRQAALRELREKEAILEQRRKSQEALRKWRTQAKNPQQQAGHRQKKPGRPRRKEAEEAETEDSSDLARKSYSNIEYEESSAVQSLRQKIYIVVQKMEERRRNPTGSKEEQIEAAERDVREMRRLQAQLLDVKRGRGFAL
ncbi:hypothetical protein WMY93_018374 [Mugilogobius chulae]|uniref:Leucine-rich repeat-containing protein 27 n=1 Tax=Mugilogobius chulae TaxID=88201 RepID=A0AAW0NTV0_9GOBI